MVIGKGGFSHQGILRRDVIALKIMAEKIVKILEIQIKFCNS